MTFPDDAALGETTHASVPDGATARAPAGAGHDAGHNATFHARTHHDDELPESPLEHWEARYTRSDRVWSGNPNATTARVVTERVPDPVTLPAAPTALDLGCGEGADAIWLASRGWRATGVDLSPTAIDRAREAAARAGVGDTPGTGVATFEARDLSAGLPEGLFDLVTASFLHAHVELARTEILRAAAERVRPGGHLLVVSHAAPPPWSQHLDEDLPGPDEDWAVLALPADRWSLEVCETVEREAVSPEGQLGVLEDGIILARRTV